MKRFFAWWGLSTLTAAIFSLSLFAVDILTTSTGTYVVLPSPINETLFLRPGVKTEQIMERIRSFEDSYMNDNGLYKFEVTYDKGTTLTVYASSVEQARFNGDYTRKFPENGYEVIDPAALAVRSAKPVRWSRLLQRQFDYEVWIWPFMLVMLGYPFFRMLVTSIEVLDTRSQGR